MGRLAGFLFNQRIFCILILVLLCVLLYLPGINNGAFDRDESWYAQVTKQMLETKNFIDMRFQGNQFYEKPPALYWLQAFSVSVFARGDRSAVWAYRLPSFFAALFAIAGFFYFAEKIFNRRIAFVAACFLATTLMTVIQAHIGQTDALLLFCAVFIFGPLGIIYLKKASNVLPHVLIFWCIQAMSFFVKGPIMGIITLLAVIVLLMIDRNRQWIKKLRLGLGLFIVACALMPWIFTMYNVSRGTFFTEAAAKGLFWRTLSGIESHGAFPGYYFLLTMITFYPASCIVYPGFFAAFKKRQIPVIRFCLSWIIPAWILFELIPTKLPHYVLPLYPAMALLGTVFITDQQAIKREKLRNYFFILWACTGIFIAAGVFVCAQIFGQGLSITVLLTGISALFIPAAGIFFWLRRKLFAAAVGASLFSVIMYFFLFQFFIPGLTALWISQRLHEKIHHYAVTQKPAITVVGFSEPSIVFLFGTETQLADVHEAVASVIVAQAQKKESFALVEKRDAFEFETIFREKRGFVPDIKDTLKGFNYTYGRWQEFFIYYFPQ